jgi:hypothetical protein
MHMIHFRGAAADGVGGPFRPAVRDCPETMKALSNESAGAPEVSRERYDQILAENEALRRALKETVLNIQSVVERAELILKRANARIADFDSGEDE